MLAMYHPVQTSHDSKLHPILLPRPIFISFECPETGYTFCSRINQHRVVDVMTLINAALTPVLLHDRSDVCFDHVIWRALPLCTWRSAAFLKP